MLVFIVFGAVYGILTNLIFDKFVSAVWTPLAIALYFVLFTVLLCPLIIVLVKTLNRFNNEKLMFRDMAIVLAALFVGSMLFEFLYELGANAEVLEPDSYIILIDDSGSMESNDPDMQRESAIKNLLKDKPSNFNYSVYTFSDAVKQARDMQPKSAGFGDLDLKTAGGTAMFGCLETVMNDILSGNLKTTSATRVLLISDGYAGDEPIFKSRILKKYVKNGIVIGTIGLGGGVDEDTLKQIAEYTGGVYIQIDNASMLDNAMIDVSVQSSTRNLLGFRGYCKTDTLHAVLRIVFILIIVGLIYILKLYSYGKIKKLNLIVTGALCFVAALLPEIALQELSWSDSFMRVIFCILISITLIEAFVPKRKSYTRTYTDEINDDDDFGDGDTSNSNELFKEQKTKDRSFNSLR